jgi:hypothetical protein
MAGSGDPSGSTKVIDLEADIATIDEYLLTDDLTVTTRETPSFPAGKELLSLAGIQDAALDGVGAKIYPDTAAGIAGTVNGQYFWIVSGAVEYSLELWRNVAGVATDTGKRTLNGDVNVILW